MTIEKIVFFHHLPREILDVITAYTPEGFTTVAVDADQPEDEKISAAEDADFIIEYQGNPSDRVLRSAHKARLVQLLSAGYDRINVNLLREMEVPCANNGGANSWAVADGAVLLILSLYKRLVLADRATRDGRWREPIDGFNTFELADKLVGIMGIGNIGKQVARRVHAYTYRGSTPGSSTTTSSPLRPSRKRSWA